MRIIILGCYVSLENTDAPHPVRHLFRVPCPRLVEKHVQQGLVMRPRQRHIRFSKRRLENVWKAFVELQEAVQIALAEASAELISQIIRQNLDNLLAVIGAISAFEYLDRDAPPEKPVATDEGRIDGMIGLVPAGFDNGYGTRLWRPRLEAFP